MLEEIGRELRARRESLGLKLEDIQRETKIRSRYLEALEEGDGDSLPAHVYARGILRRYCQQLGMDSRPLLEKFSQWQAKDGEPPLVDGLARTPGTGKITLRRARQSRGARVWIFASAVLLLLSAAAVYYLIILPQAELPPETPPAAEEEPPESEEPPPNEEEPEDEVEEPPAEPLPAVTREPGPGAQDIRYLVEG
ncbi:MAG: helix-turn-helix domain-containing protein, partial [Bacillota bacterium]